MILRPLFNIITKKDSFCKSQRLLISTKTFYKYFVYYANATSVTVSIQAVARLSYLKFSLPYAPKTPPFFEWLATGIVTAFGNMRRVTFALVFVTYFGSMIMANDMALITFLPLGWLVLSSCGKTKYTAFVFVMQNVAANLGRMLTPFGNPQNLYLYSFFEIDAGEFFAIMAIPYAVAFVLIACTCLVVKPEPIRLETPPEPAPPVWRTVVYFVLFALSVMIVFRVFPYYVGLIVVTVALAVLEPKCFLRVDYGLLLTFCAFFVFSGNLSRIPRDMFLALQIKSHRLKTSFATVRVLASSRLFNIRSDSPTQSSSAFFLAVFSTSLIVCKYASSTGERFCTTNR